MKNDKTFDEIAERWKADKKPYVKRSTYAAYSLLIANHLRPAFGTQTEITEALVQRFVLDKLTQGLSQKSIKDILTVLKMILKFGVKNELTEYRRIDIKFPTPRERHRIEVLSKTQQRRIMAYIADHFTCLNLGIYICLCTGMRIGEICALTWDDIDTEAGIIKIDKTIQRIYLPEGGAKRTEVVIDTPKSENSIREIPMSRSLLRLVKPLKRAADGRFFVLTNTLRPTEPRIYRNYYKRFLQELGIPALKFHGLRHSFATRCIESRCDYKTVSVLLGHSNISTTLNLYVHPNLEQKKRCVEQMSRSLR
ncbi:MAG: site-specific integrase [Rikenella sp.]|nr:site-specific integrase [Rikenella sp.]